VRSIVPQLATALQRLDKTRVRPILGGLVEQLKFVNQSKPPNVVRTHKTQRLTKRPGRFARRPTAGHRAFLTLYRHLS